MMCVCGRARMPVPGDALQLGDLVGHPMEPSDLYARVVGLRKDKCTPMERVIMRVFQPGDTTFPTGEYRTSWLVVPWYHKHEGVVDGELSGSSG